MYQKPFVDFKLGYVDAKSDAIAFSVKTYSLSSFIKNRTNMDEMQNRMKITFCVKPPNLPFCLRIKGTPREVLGGASVGLAPALPTCQLIKFLFAKYTKCNTYIK